MKYIYKKYGENSVSVLVNEWNIRSFILNSVCKTEPHYTVFWYDHSSKALIDILWVKTCISTKTAKKNQKYNFHFLISNEIVIFCAGFYWNRSYQNKNCYENKK